jgi:hypothetical protein
MILFNVEKLHESLVRLRSIGLLEYVGRSPKDKLQALTTGAKTNYRLASIFETSCGEGMIEDVIVEVGLTGDQRSSASS